MTTITVTTFGLGAEALIIIATVCLWGWLSTRTTNNFLKQFMILETLLMTVALGWTGWFAVTQGDVAVLDIWRYIVSILFLAWIGVYSGLWITGALDEEEIDNGF